MKTTRLFRALWVLGIALGLSALLRAQGSASPPNSEPAAIQALVSEIRELRLSLERSTQLSMRLQLGLQWSQIRVERVKDLSRQLNGVASQLSALAGDRADATTEIREREQDLASSEPTVRKAAEQAIARLRAILDSMAASESELRSRESALRAEMDRETSQIERWERWLEQLDASPQMVK